jgi:DNA recombination protein RmuC
MDTNLIYIIISMAIILALGIGILIAYINKKISKPQNENTQDIMLEIIKDLREEVQNSGTKNRQEIQQRLDQIDNRITKNMQHTSMSTQEQSKQNTKIIQDITHKLTKLDETNKQVLNFSEQLQSLENILKNPKQRGILGEYFLESLLSQVLSPNQYKMQHKFADGEIVDAAIYIKDQIIPIDAKFSLEKYNKMMEEKHKNRREEIEKDFKNDVKKRIDETAKYIRPQEGTADFALMFIPAEGIFYNLLIYKTGTANVNTQNLIEYAFSKRVMITSPTSFFAYLQTILQGLKALKIEQSVKVIKKNIINLSKHLNTYQENINKLGNHLGTTVNSYNHATKEFTKIDKDIYKITDGNHGGNVNLPLIDKPIKENE